MIWKSEIFLKQLTGHPQISLGVVNPVEHVCPTLQGDTLHISFLSLYQKIQGDAMHISPSSSYQKIQTLIAEDLENSEHRLTDIVKAGDTPLRPLPVGPGYEWQWMVLMSNDLWNVDYNDVDDDGNENILADSAVGTLIKSATRGRLQGGLPWTIRVIIISILHVLWSGQI